MKENFSIFAYLLASLIIIAFFAKGLDYFIARSEPAVNTTSEVLRDDEGKLKYASGTCENDSECLAEGCSMEFCASEGIVSTCELKPDAPDRETYKCGCSEGYCAWKK